MQRYKHIEKLMRKFKSAHSVIGIQQTLEIDSVSSLETVNIVINLPDVIQVSDYLLTFHSQQVKHFLAAVNIGVLNFLPILN